MSLATSNGFSDTVCIVKCKNMLVHRCPWDSVIWRLAWKELVDKSVVSNSDAIVPLSYSHQCLPWWLSLYSGRYPLRPFQDLQDTLLYNFVVLGKQKVPSEDRWRTASMVLFHKHVRPYFPSATANVNMKSCVEYWSDILAQQDTSILFPHVKFCPKAWEDVL